MRRHSSSMLILQNRHEALGILYYSRAMYPEAVNEVRSAVALAVICYGTNHWIPREMRNTLEQYQQRMIVFHGGVPNVAFAPSTMPGPAPPEGGSRSGSPVWVLERDDFPEAFQRDKYLIDQLGPVGGVV
jgi:hypothetical protein